MTIALPSYFWSQDQNIDRRTTEQDEFNRRAANEIEQIGFVLVQFFGELSEFQQKDFILIKTTNPIQDFRFRHSFGKIATNYTLLGAQNNGGGSATVEWPGRPANPIPTTDVDDEEFITLSFTGRATYIIRVQYDTRIDQGFDTLEGPV